jgi:hypothetical protein
MRTVTPPICAVVPTTCGSLLIIAFAVRGKVGTLASGAAPIIQ